MPRNIAVANAIATTVPLYSALRTARSWKSRAIRATPTPTTSARGGAVSDA